MKKITNSFKMVIDPAVLPGYVYLISPQRSGKSTYLVAMLKLQDSLNQKYKEIKNSWLYFPDDRTEIERICNGIDMGARPARSTLDNWRYDCLTDNARSSMGLGEN